MRDKRRKYFENYQGVNCGNLGELYQNHTNKTLLNDVKSIERQDVKPQRYSKKAREIKKLI